MVKYCVLLEVRTESLNIIQNSFGLSKDYLLWILVTKRYVNAGSCEPRSFSYSPHAIPRPCAHSLYSAWPWTWRGVFFTTFSLWGYVGRERRTLPVQSSLAAARSVHGSLGHAHLLYEILAWSTPGLSTGRTDLSCNPSVHRKPMALTLKRKEEIPNRPEQN